ncbi:MAG: pilus assembly protein [Bdellovibrionota bacterium]
MNLLEKNPRRKSRGAIFVEAAIVLPVVLLTLSFGINLGIIVDNLEQANDSVGEGVRYGVALGTNSGATEIDVKTAVEHRILSNFINYCTRCSSINVEATFSDFSSGGVSGRQLTGTLFFNYDILGIPIPGVSSLSLSDAQAVFYTSS